MRYVGVLLGFAAALVVWPLLPFMFLIVCAWALLQTHKENKRAKLQEVPPPISEPMLGQVFAKARREIHTLNAEHMERCYRQEN